MTQLTVRPSVDDTGVEGNSRLTSATGVLLLVLLAVEGATILRIHQLISVHVFLGLMLLGPVALKCASTLYRFARYYTHAEPYVRRGPPHPILRLLGPLVVLTSLAVLGTGVGLIFQSAQNRGGFLLFAHKASFVLWFGLMAVHVLGHLREVATESMAEVREATPGRRWRWAAVAVSLVVGLALAGLLYPSATAWTSGSGFGHDDRGPAAGAPALHR